MNKIELAKVLGLELYATPDSECVWQVEWIFSLPRDKYNKSYFSLFNHTDRDTAWEEAADKVVFVLQKQVVFNMGKELREEAY